MVQLFSTKKYTLSVDDINLALSMNKLEAVYGLSVTESTITGTALNISNGIVSFGESHSQRCPLFECLIAFPFS